MKYGIAVGNGRVIYVGQVWQSNDPRRLRAVRVVSFNGRGDRVRVKNLVSRQLSEIAVSNFTTGSRGWSLLEEAR